MSQLLVVGGRGQSRDVDELPALEQELQLVGQPDVVEGRGDDGHPQVSRRGDLVEYPLLRTEFAVTSRTTTVDERNAAWMLAAHEEPPRISLSSSQGSQPSPARSSATYRAQRLSSEAHFRQRPLRHGHLKAEPGSVFADTRP